MSNSTGWKDGELSPIIYVNPPADEIYEFNFIAVPPGPNDMVIEVLTEIRAEYSWENFPDELKGVRIYAVSNSKESVLS